MFKKIKRLLFGKPYKPRYSRGIPNIYILQLKASKNINKWKIKYITQKDMYNILTSAWFLTNARYPNKVKLIKGEIGANVFSKTRYILKP